MAKNIFNDFDYAKYYELLESAKNDGVHLVHTFDRDFHKGGVTIAWQRTGANGHGRMLNVSVCYCSPKDYFARKIGAFNALADFYSGAKIKVPLNDEDSMLIVNNLRDMFATDFIITW